MLSSVRAYAEVESLAFSLHQKQMALKFFAAQTRARQFGVTADVMLRSSQASAGYYEIVQNSLADLVSSPLSDLFKHSSNDVVVFSVLLVRFGFTL